MPASPRMDERTAVRTDPGTVPRWNEDHRRAWIPENRDRAAESCMNKADEILAAGIAEDTTNKRGCKSAAQVWMSLLSLCDRMCGSTAWLVLFTCLHGVRLFFGGGGQLVGGIVKR